MTLLCAGWRHTGLFWIPLQVNVQIADKRQCECFRGGVPLSCAPLRHSTMKYSKLSARNKNLSRKKKKKEREEALCVPRLFFYLQSGLQQRGNGKLKRLAAPGPPPPPLTSPPLSLLPSRLARWNTTLCVVETSANTTAAQETSALCFNPPHLSHLSFSQPHIHR